MLRWFFNWVYNRTVRSTAVIENNVFLGSDGFIGHNVVIRSGTVIGNDVVIGHNVVIEENVTIGNGTRIQSCAYITKNTIIEDQVFIGPCVMTANDWHILSHGRPGPVQLKGPHIMYGARIGIGAILMPGITVGRNALVGAGSIVSKDVHENDIVHGERAAVTGKVSEEDRI